MFLNQTQPRSVYGEVKEFISNQIVSAFTFSRTDQISATPLANAHAVKAYAKRGEEIEHKRTLAGLGMSDWR